MIKTWKERKGLENSEPFRSFIGVEFDMQQEINELRAALVERVPQEGYMLMPKILTPGMNHELNTRLSDHWYGCAQAVWEIVLSAQNIKES